MAIKVNLKTAATLFKLFQGKQQGMGMLDTIKTLPTSSVQPDIIELAMKRANLAPDNDIITKIVDLAGRFPGKTIGEVISDPGLPDTILALLEEADNRFADESVEIYEVPHVCPSCRAHLYVRMLPDFLGEGNLLGHVPLKDIQLPTNPWDCTTYLKKLRPTKPNRS